MIPHGQTSSIKGLSTSDVGALQSQYGRNILSKKKKLIPPLLVEVVTEPMFLLLIVACVIYLMLGEPEEGFMIMAALLLVAAISIFQGIRSTRALKALKNLTEPRVKVIRDGIESIIISAELVPGDIMVLEEGEKIPADALIIRSNDLLLNESVITGESLPAEKKESETIYQGTSIQGGMCYAEVKATGNNTELGKIGKSVEAYIPPKTRLQMSIRKFVQRLALFGILGFAAIWIMNYFRTGEILTSLLSGLTLIMAAIPEEIPVAFSSFMALGAYRLSKKGIISRHPVVIENLGAVSVICLDKTGTITQNRMEVRSAYDYVKGTEGPPSASDVLYYARLASEITPYDEMEKAIQKAGGDSPSMAPEELFFEYSLEGRPPMMTHVWGKDGKYTVAAKGAPERIMEVCRLNEEERDRISQMIISKAAEGHRVLAVAECSYQGTLPASQNEFPWQFKGFISLYDPPKKGIDMVFRQFKEAGIQIKLITGDYPQTARNIASQAGIYNGEKHMDGKSVMSMDMVTLQENVKEHVIFARMHPEAKLKVIEALKLNGEIVAMTGDGVNDGPALKASHIGIAMGKHGTQIARQASDIILTDDDMSKVTEAIEQGRKIFANLKKAIRYIISIHIPIILIASLPLLLNWKYPSIFTPIHVIFLELIMGPTCSIFFENEPTTPGLMKKHPRKRDIGLFTGRELLISIIQGLAITAGILGLHYHYSAGHSLAEVRSIVFTTLLVSNIFLTFTNRSFSSPIFHTIRYRNSLVPVVLTVSTLFILILHAVPEVRMLFGMEPITARDMMTCLIVSLVSVSWIELIKIGYYYRQPRT